MFCFETAMKALYWSILVYRYEQSAPDQTRDPIKVRPDRVPAQQCMCMFRQTSVDMPLPP